MKRQLLRTLIVACGLLAVCAAEPKPASAGVVSDVWWALFGPPGTPWFGGPRSGYGYYGGGYTAYYGGGYYGGYSCRPACNPCCQPCDPCACNPCASPCSPCGSGGPCAVPGGGGPQTFKNGEYRDQKPPVPMKDSEFEKREGSKKFGPTRKEVKEKEKADPKTDNNKPPEPGKAKKGPFSGTDETAVIRQSLKPAVQGPIIRTQKPAPPKPPMETERKIERLDLDGKVTWKPVVRRTRLIINSTLRSPNIARTTIDPNSRWQPVPGSTRIVRK